MMMDCAKNPNLQPKEEEEEEQEEKDDSAESSSLYLHLLSDSGGDGNLSVFYKIDSSSDEPNFFSQKPKLISENIPKNLPYIGFGSAICDSILYLFGGGRDDYFDCSSNKAGYLDLASSSNMFVPLEHTMNAIRCFPITVTVGKNIYIFGSSEIPGYGVFPGYNNEENWAEVFNTEDKLFKLISPPPPALFETCRVRVTALINKNEILLATEYFSDMFIYNVETDQWTHPARDDDDTVSPFGLSSIMSPVIDNKYIFLYGSGKICAFDIDKNQFLKNNISLLEYTFFDNEEAIFLRGVIHHLGGWRFSVVFADANGYLVSFIYVVSFEIENPEHFGELNIKAGTINVVDHVLPGQTFVDSLLWSNQIVPLGNPNNGKRSLKRKLSVGGSCVTSHVDEDCMMNNNGATSRPELSRLRPEMMAELPKLRRKEAALDKEISEMRLRMTIEMDKWKVKLPISEHSVFSDKLERLKSKLSKTNMSECVKNENVSEIKTGCLLEEISSIKDKVKAQLIERSNLMFEIHEARSGSSFFMDLFGIDCKD